MIGKLPKICLRVAGVLGVLAVEGVENAYYRVLQLNCDSALCPVPRKVTQAVPLIPPSEFFFRTFSFQISAAKFYKCVGLARQHQGRGVAVIHGNTGKVDYSASQYTTSHGCHYSGIFWERVLTRSDVHCLSVLLHRALLQHLRGGSNALAPGTDTEGRVRTRVS